VFLYASIVGALGLDFLFGFPHIGQAVMIVSSSSLEKEKERKKADRMNVLTVSCEGALLAVRVPLCDFGFTFRT
jgi:hypothetical protein